jgi:predicted transposase/invertase (TIGR01784 family)
MQDHEIFMNLRADFAFKRVFGTESNKKALIRFLNVLFKKDGIVVRDVAFHDKEVLPKAKSDSDPTKREKQIIYDVYCSAKGINHHFILEMQQRNTSFFDDRAFYYAAKALALQGESGWDYNLYPVFSIFILGFNLPGHTEKLIQDFRMMEMESHELYSDKLRMIFISLPKVKRKWSECKTEEDRLLFIIKNMHKMTKNSEPYKSGEYRDLFDASEINSLAEEDMVLYSQSYAKMRENELAIEYAVAEGRAEGRAEGLAEGRAEERHKAIKAMFENGLGIEVISSIYNLSEDEIKQILKL